MEVIVRDQRSSPRLLVITVNCKIHDDNKEKPGSYHVVVKKSGETIFDASKWGLGEDWDNGTHKVIASGSLKSRDLPAKGSYIIEVSIDSGNNIDVDHEWWLGVEDSDGNEFESTHGPREHWVNDVRSNTYKVSVAT